MLRREIIKVLFLVLIGIIISVYLYNRFSVNSWMIWIQPLYIPGVVYGVKTIVSGIISVLSFLLKNMMMSIMFKSLAGGITVCLVCVLGLIIILSLGAIIGLGRIIKLMIEDYNIDQELSS